jgi:TetR/AcrR family transcriptional repressor of uid operon
MRKSDPDLHRRRADQISQAAGEVFLVRGFHRTSMADIAREAGVSMGLLYRYFENKEAIIAAVAALDRRDDLERLRGMGTAADVTLALTALISEAVKRSADSRYVALLAEITAESCRNPAIAGLLRDDHIQNRDALAEALGALQMAGRIRPEQDPQALAVWFLTVLDGLSLTMTLMPDTDLAAILRSLTDVLENGLILPPGQA